MSLHYAPAIKSENIKYISSYVLYSEVRWPDALGSYFDVFVWEIQDRESRWRNIFGLMSLSNHTVNNF